MSEQTSTGWERTRALVVLVLLLGLLAAAFYGAAVALDHLRTGVAAGVLTASATVLISVITLVASQRADRRKMIEQSVRERKVPLYDDLIRFWMETTLLAEELTETEMTERWKKFSRESLHTLILWMSEPVLAAYNELRAVLLRNERAGGIPEGSYELIFAFEDLLFAVRKDLGHSNKGIERGDLLRLWVNDVDDVLEKISESPTDAPTASGSPSA